MFKQSIAVLAAATSLLSTVAAAENETKSINFNFTEGDAGFVPIFADYPISDNSHEFYELKSELSDIPIENAGKGLFISGNNHSDDLFMGYYKELSGFAPGTPLVADISFKLATNVDGGLIGIGGSPGSSVFVKCGITAKKPDSVKNGNMYYLNLDKGNQGADGKDMKIVGTIEKQETLYPDKFEFNSYNTVIEVTPDESGNAYLIIGTDSGFEGTTSYYIGDVDIKVSDKETYELEKDLKEALSLGIIENTDSADEDIDRLQFCDAVYNMLNSVKELPAAKLSNNPFEDINNPKINTLAFVKIISGKENRIFAPNDKITREEAAAVLYRAAVYAGAELPQFKADIEYSDNNEISSWAISSVYSLKMLNIMNDISGEFKPKSNYTVRESVSSIMKLYRIINK